MIFLVVVVDEMIMQSRSVGVGWAIEVGGWEMRLGGWSPQRALTVALDGDELSLALLAPGSL
jgi:hypothetical protein